MFCPKCHTYIEDDSIKFCKRCGTEINKNKKYSTFSSTSTFKYMSKYGKNSHQDQYEYSKDYSNVKNEADDTHVEQFNYSNKYSNVKKEVPNEHADQHNYSKNYSKVKINNDYDHEDHYNYSRLYNIRENYVTSDDDYLKAFIGSNYKDISKMKYSFPSLVFGPLYLIYRKMFTVGIALEILILIIQFFATESISTTVNVLINLALFYKFKNLYINFAHKKVDEIKTLNSDKSSTEIINLCKFKGGTISLKKFALYAFIIYILSTIISALTANVPTEDNLEKYTIKDYEYKIDKKLSTSDNKTITEDYQRFAYITSDDNCTYTIHNIGSNYSARNYLLSKQYIHSADYNASSIQTEKNNNSTWEKQTFQAKYGNRIINYYVLEDNNNLYSIEYQTNNNSLKCQNIEKTILKTFKKLN